MEPLQRAFYDRDTGVVARDLLGAHLVRTLPEARRGGHRLVGRIVETEAYYGPADGASHARSGRTPRTTVMFGPLGHAYIYFVYGMHWLLNVVARCHQPAGAVLLRAVEPLEGNEIMRQRRNGRGDEELANGPAKLCQALRVNGDLNGLDLCDAAGPLVIASGPPVPETEVAAGSRIGIRNTPEPWQSRPLRYWIRESRFVSRQGRRR